MGCKGKEIWSPEPQFIGKETFYFVFSLRNSRVFFFFFSKSVLLRRRRDIARNAWTSHTHTYFSRLSLVFSVFTLTPDLNPDLSFYSLRTQTHFRSSLPFTLPFGWREAQAIRLTARAFLTWEKNTSCFAVLFVTNFLQHNFDTGYSKSS